MCKEQKHMRRPPKEAKKERIALTNAAFLCKLSNIRQHAESERDPIKSPFTKISLREVRSEVSLWTKKSLLSQEIYFLSFLFLFREDSECPPVVIFCKIAAEEK